MSRALFLPLTMMIVIATAMAMLASAILLPTSAITAIPGPDGTDVVERFYAAVNETIATGNPAPVQRVVNPSFADENPLPGVSPGRAGLEAYLVTLHDVDPGLRLEADVIISSGEQVMTRVRVIPGVAQPAFDAPRAIWSPIEVFRLANREIVERWGHTDGLTLARPLAAQQVELPVPTPRIVSLMRITLAPGARWDAPRVEGPRLLFLEQGVMQVQFSQTPPAISARHPGPSIASDNQRADSAQQTQHTNLTAGASWQAPAGAATSATSTGRTEASLLVVTFSEPKIPNGGALPSEAGSLSSGVMAQVLAGDLATHLGTDAVTVTLEQIACAPGASLNLWSSEGPTLLAVRAGQLETTTRGTSWVRRSGDGMSVASPSGPQTTNNGMLLQPGGMVVLRNVEPYPAIALVVTIQRLGPERSQ